MRAGQESSLDVVLAGLVVSLRPELERTRERILELETRLAQTPRNSSGPQSSEELATRAVTATR